MKTFFTLLLATMCFLLPKANGQVAAVQTMNGFNFNWGGLAGLTGKGTAGWSFNVGSTDITVTTLGLFDAGGDGLVEAHEIGIWTNAGVLLASTTIPAGTTGTLNAGYRYVPIPPLVLTSGQSYVIGAFYGVSSADKIIFHSSQTFANLVNYIQSRTDFPQDPTSLSYPSLYPSGDQGVFGPNFQFTFCLTDPIVTTNADAGPGSLRQAILDACPGSVITFDPSLNGQTITLASTLPTINKNLTITGPGANLLTISGNDVVQLFRVTGADPVMISGLIMADGKDASTGGGALHNTGRLTLANCTFKNNNTTSPHGGGAVYVLSFNLTTIIEGCTFLNNSSIVSFIEGKAGAVMFAAPGSITNSTFTGNRAVAQAGAIRLDANSSIINCTITGNAVIGNGGGGGVSGSNSLSNSIYNSIIAGNTSAGSAPDVAAVYGGTNNIIGTPSGHSYTNGVDGNKVGTAANPINPLLGPLADNGGTTQTIALLPGSPAINAGTNTNAPATDQRGFGRVGTVDIGAFELQTLATNTAITSSPNPSCFGSPVTFSATVTGGGNPVTEGTVDFKEGATILSTIAVDDAGHASFNISSLTAGPHTIEAVYNGTAAFVTSNDYTAQTINPLPTIANITGTSTCAGTATTLTASSAASNPSFIWSEIPIGGGGGAGKVLSTNASYTTDILNSNTSYNLKITDGTTHCSSTSVVDVTVNPLPVISPATLPAGKVGVGYSQNITASGGTGSSVIGLLSGMPPGLTLISSGLLSGTPTTTGTYLLNVYAKDTKGCTATMQYSITISAACTIICPANITVNNKTGLCGAYVTYPAATSSGNCGTLTYSIKSGSWFAVGTTTVTVKASSGASCSFTVTVKDVQKPVIVCPSDITVTAAANACTKAVNFSINAVDNCSGVVVTSVPASGSVFNVGTTTVTATATDLSGNKTTSTFTVKVKESQPPVIKIVATPIVLLWPANGSYQTINLSQCVLSVTDNCSSIPVSSVKITKVTSDEADNASGDADGNTTRDIKIASDCKSVELRRERNSKGNGRVYTIYLSVTDAGGNTGTATFKVIAPVNQGGTTAVDNGSACSVSSYCSGNNYRPGGGTTEEQEPTVKNEIPEGFMMDQNYPNPFSSVTTIRYAIPVEAKVSLGVYNELGQRVSQLTEGKMSAGYHQSMFDATKLASGIYICRLLAVDAEGKPVLITKKMIVAK